MGKLGGDLQKVGKNVSEGVCLLDTQDTIANKGDLKRGRELWSKIYPICALLEEANYGGAVKTGMEMRGWKTGGMR